jgi:hypothetical protein
VEAILELRGDAGPVRLGSTYETRNRIAGPWREWSRWEVTASYPPRRQVHDGEGFFGPSYVRALMELTPLGAATEVTITLVYRPRFALVGELVDRAVAGAVERAHRRSVENLRDLVERELARAA